MTGGQKVAGSNPVTPIVNRAISPIVDSRLVDKMGDKPNKLWHEQHVPREYLPAAWC